MFFKYTTWYERWYKKCVWFLTNMTVKEKLCNCQLSNSYMVLMFKIISNAIKNSFLCFKNHVCAWVYTHHTYAGMHNRDLERVSGSQELELQMVLSCHGGPGSRPRSSARATVLSHLSSLSPLFTSLTYGSTGVWIQCFLSAQ